MKLITPRSDQGKLDLLEAILTQATAPNSVVPGLPNHLVEALLEMREQFKNQYEHLLVVREAWNHRLAVQRKQARELRFLLRDAYSQVKRRGRKINMPAHVYQMFDLSARGTQSQAVRELRAPVEIAMTLLVAAEHAAEKGFVLFYDEELEELRSAAQALRTAEQERVEARNEERESLAEMRLIREQLHNLFLRLKLAVRLTCVGLSAADQQQCFRALGFSYREEKMRQEAVVASDEVRAGPVFVSRSKSEREPDEKAVGQGMKTACFGGRSTVPNQRVACSDVPFQQYSGMIRPRERLACFASQPQLRYALDLNVRQPEERKWLPSKCATANDSVVK